ncbi:hypothetical protein [Halarcobacter ebronensis]|uniref:hypothetical protein n=1 Tax=Halarcobacter ebronensis TaxID=1462615 RepID=UPI001009B1CE|nr:hypothetical protein [Halarcobacter ebronensis]
MKEELIIYYLLVNEIQTLNDTYTLCSGLLIVNPTKQNIQQCNYIYEKIKIKVAQVEKQCPYITFYSKYIN